MSKRDELRNLRRQCSADAPINIRGRTGESSSVGVMLDLYAHSKSPEEVIFAKDEIKARERFERGFDVYMERIFDEREREFLRELLHGTQTAHKVGVAFGVNYFKFLQAIQRKAYKNAKPLIKLARRSGWEGATEFIRVILQRLQALQNGAKLNELIPQNQRELERLKKQRIYNRNYKKEHLEQVRRNARISNRRCYARKMTMERNARIQNLEKKLSEAFDLLSNALMLWVSEGKPLNANSYRELNEKDNIFGNVCKELQEERAKRYKPNKEEYRYLADAVLTLNKTQETVDVGDGLEEERGKENNE